MVLWIFLEVVMVKDKKVKKKCIGFKGFAVKSCSKTSFFCFSQTWPTDL